MIDLGDVVTLQTTTRDAAGTPGNATTVVATVTTPSGVATNPAVTAVGSGVYSIAYATTEPGRHTVRWVATGVNPGAWADVFWVAPADPGLLISLAEARTSLRFLAAQTADDEDVRSIIAAATGPMEDLCGPIVPRTCDEWHDGGTSMVTLDHAPVISVTSVTESAGSMTRQLTEQPLSGASFDAWGFTVNTLSGILTRRTVGVDAPFEPGRGNVHVVYRAGRLVMPANLLRATRRLVRHLWQTEMLGLQPTQIGEPLTVTPSGFAIPNAVVELCAAELRLRAVAG